MSYTVDYSAAHTYIDGRELVSYTTPGGVTTSSVVARRGTVTKSDYTGDTVGLTPSDVAFVLWSDVLSGTEPQAGGYITDAGGVSYSVLVVTKRADGAQFRAIGRRRV